jgi:hypothetical protein
MSNDQDTKDTSDPSSPEAPQTHEYAEEHEMEPDDQLQPGGRHGTPAATGMSGLDADKKPGGPIKDR